MAPTWSGFSIMLAFPFIAIFTTYKQVLIFNFANRRAKESFVSTANKLLVGTLITIGDITVSIASLAWCC